MSLMSLLFGDPEPSDKELAQAYKLFQLVNSQRQKRNLPPLTPLPALDKAARAMALDMVKYEHVRGHQDTRKLWPTDRAKEAGYRWSHITENLAYQIGSPQAAIDYWMREREYQQNILDQKFVATGMACYGNNYVQVFATEVRW